MAKSKYLKFTLDAGNWPKEKDLAEIRERLSAVDENDTEPSVLGSKSLVDQIKANMCSKIVEYHIKSGASQKDLAERLGVDEPEMSRLLHYKLQRYSIDRLVGYLEILYPKIKFNLVAA